MAALFVEEGHLYLALVFGDRRQHDTVEQIDRAISWSGGLS
jgi:hypothetical protein